MYLFISGRFWGLRLHWTVQGATKRAGIHIPTKGAPLHFETWTFQRELASAIFPAWTFQRELSSVNFPAWTSKCVKLSRGVWKVFESFGANVKREVLFQTWSFREVSERFSPPNVNFSITFSVHFVFFLRYSLYPPSNCACQENVTYAGCIVPIVVLVQAF